MRGGYEDLKETAKRYDEAIMSFVDKVRGDPNVIAVLVNGSVYHGTVWEKSDVDMTVVVRDQKLDKKYYAVYEDNILINADIVQRSELKRGMERGFTGTIGHSIDATTKVVYTTDDSLYEYVEENRRMGRSDAEKSIFQYANWCLGLLEKVEKWLVVKRDVTYARLYMLKAAEPLASMEVCAHMEVPTREAILQAAKLNPALIDRFYTKPMSGPMTEDEIYTLLDEAYAYLEAHMDAFLSVLSELFGDGEIKTGTHIAKHFHSPMHYIHPMMDFLCDRGHLEKLSQTIRITPKGRQCVEEIAFLMPQGN